MGHELCEGAWPRLIDEIDGFARAVAARPANAAT